MFPTTIWTTIRQAADDDREALESFARHYRDPVYRYIRSRGLSDEDAQDLCQDVFVRILRADLLGKADAQRGRFRGLVLTVARNAVTDRLRRAARPAIDVDEVDPAEDHDAEDAEFDRGWAWHLTERALERLQRDGSPYYDVLRGHLDGETQDRNKLWIARKKLAACLRHEVAFTCVTEDDFEAELAYLSQFLRPSALGALNDRD